MIIIFLKNNLRGTESDKLNLYSYRSKIELASFFVREGDAFEVCGVGSHGQWPRIPLSSLRAYSSVDTVLSDFLSLAVVNVVMLSREL